MQRVKYTVDERLFRNNNGQLHIGYVTRLIQDGTLEADDLVSYMSKQTSMPEPKILYLLNTLKYALIKNLCAGKCVEVPNLGRFRLGLKSKAQPREKDAGKKAMESISINFVPCVEIKRVINVTNLVFEIQNPKIPKSNNNK